MHIFSLLLAILGVSGVLFHLQLQAQTDVVPESDSALIQGKFPSFDPRHPPSTDKTATFKLSQNYPNTFAVEEPWKSINFRTDTELYLKSILTYSLEGNTEGGFRGYDNKVRKWYHAPWLHSDGSECGNGREHLHGLTRERGTPAHEIHVSQHTLLENWAIGFYNAPGGYTLGQVWNTNSGEPDPMLATFPEGTATFKLLFTDGATEQVPFLNGSFELEANIYNEVPYKRLGGKKICIDSERHDRTVRLIQVDVAVKDNRAAFGWVFGTFIYDSSAEGETPWDRLVPVGASWGNDSGITSMLTRDHAFINSDLKQTYLNAALMDKEKTFPPNKASVRYHGVGGRLNGPVDNPISSCFSCHGQAAVQSNGKPMDLANFTLHRLDMTPDYLDVFFGDVAPGAYRRTFKDEVFINLDYSLQLSAGIRNYYENINKLLRSTDISLSSTDSGNQLGRIETTPLPIVSRGGPDE